jgi:hypothetical protein
MSKRSGGKAAPMTQAAASRIQSRTAKQSGGAVAPGSFAARAQRGAALNAIATKAEK